MLTFGAHADIQSNGRRCEPSKSSDLQIQRVKLAGSGRISPLKCLRTNNVFVPWTHADFGNLLLKPTWKGFLSAISLDSICFHICAPAISKLQQLPYECEGAIVFSSTKQRRRKKRKSEKRGEGWRHTGKNECDHCGRCGERQEVGVDGWGGLVGWVGERNLASLMETSAHSLLEHTHTHRGQTPAPIIRTAF